MWWIFFALVGFAVGYWVVEPKPPKSRLQVSYHEAGHSVMARLSPSTLRVNLVQVISHDTGSAQYQFRSTHSAKWEAVSISLAGYVAETLRFGQVSPVGSEKDFWQARQFIHDILMDGIEPVSPPWGEETPVDFNLPDWEPEENRVLQLCYAHTVGVLSRNWALVDRFAHFLDTHQVLTQEDLDTFFRMRGR